MCGIACVYDLNSKEQNKNLNIIKKMTKTISHRGPDKLTICKLNGHAFVGFVRLSMLDINNSNQPITNETKTLYLLFNGEIYNHKQLRKKLEKLGHTFSSNGDGEVIVHLYEEYGKNCVKYLDGMFAICVINLKNNSVFCARDFCGIKPLYYCLENNKLLVCSELKALLGVRDINQINFEALDLYLNIRFIPAPFCIIKNIYKIEPGECLEFKDGKIKKYRYFKTNKIFIKNKEKIYNLLPKSVKETTIADVKMGIFLSGGFDSFIISSINKNRKNLLTFSVGYESVFDYDEQQKAKEIAKTLGYANDSKTIKDSEILNLLQKSVYALDEPMYSTVSPSTLKLSSMAKNNVKGVLSGDGSDELFFGYKYVKDALQDNNIFDKYLNGISWLKYIDVKEIFPKSQLTPQKLLKVLLKNCEMPTPCETLRRVELFKKMPEYHLCRMDRLGMRNGIEARFPFLTKKIIINALSTDPKEIINTEDAKLYLKQKLNRFMIDDMWQTKKQPFTAPIKNWIEGCLWEDINKYFNNNLLLKKLHLNQNKCLQILKNYKGEYADVSNVWGIYLLLKWIDAYKKYIN